MKNIITLLYVVFAITGCTGGVPVYYNPNAAMMLDYSARMLAPQNQYYGNPYIRPTVHTTCTQMGMFTNCNSY